MRRGFRRCGARLGSPLGVAAFAWIVLTGCDAALLSEGPTSSCTEAGEQCQLPEGPLGVCERTRCGAVAVFCTRTTSVPAQPAPRVPPASKPSQLLPAVTSGTISDTMKPSG